jgi:hypothetical protein
MPARRRSVERMVPPAPFWGLTRRQAVAKKAQPAEKQASRLILGQAAERAADALSDQASSAPRPACRLQNSCKFRRLVTQPSIDIHAALQQ